MKEKTTNTTSTCTGCKYFGACGDINRVEVCSGFQKEETITTTMKTPEQVRKEQDKNRAKIAELEKELDTITHGEEIKSAIQTHNMERYKELNAIKEQNKERIGAICNEIYLLKVVSCVLSDNYRASVVNKALPIIRDACSQFEGKPYGEKTKQKIRDAVRAQGYTFFFDGYLTRDRLALARIDERGCVNGVDFIDIYAKHDTPFVDKENKLHFPAELKNPVTYSDNPRKKAKEIIKAFELFKKQAEQAEKAQNALNLLLPRCIDHFHKVNRPNNNLVY